MHLLLISPCDLLINVTLNVSIINVSYVRCKYNKYKFSCCVPHTKLSYWQFFLLATSSLIFGRLYFAVSKMFHKAVLTGYNDE